MQIMNRGTRSIHNELFNVNRTIGCFYPIWLCLLLWIFPRSCNSIANFHRISDKLFAPSFLVKDRVVTCDEVRPESQAHAQFPSDTWSCYNMKVGGRRVRYWYIPGFGAESACSDGKRYYDNKNDISALCREMMKVHGIERHLWTAYVNNASCSHSSDERFIYTVKNNQFHWDTFSSGKGYIITLRCMAVE